MNEYAFKVQNKLDLCCGCVHKRHILFRNFVSCIGRVVREATNSPLYFCEDRFDLPNDMENFMEYHVMGSVSTKFTCQPGRKTQTSNTTERPYIAKKRRMMILEECEKRFEESTIVEEPPSSKEIASCSSVQHIVEEVPQLPASMLHKAIQIHICKTFRSKANQTKVHLVNQMTSPLKPYLHSVSTSPFKIKHDVNCNPSRPSINVLSKIVETNRTIRQ
ncbi:hypothetical protein ACJJTC_014963 [Scirpophaga incertulas]